jgi:hypothetical protein
LNNKIPLLQEEVNQIQLFLQIKLKKNNAEVMMPDYSFLRHAKIQEDTLYLFEGTIFLFMMFLLF